MAACDLSYHRPATLAEACELGRSFGRLGRFLAGGTELVVDFRSGRDSATQLISLKNIPGLDDIELFEGELRIGAMATLSSIAASSLVRKSFPALAEGILLMAGEQIRNQASIGGNFCRAVSCADTPPICMVGGATLKITGPGKERVVDAGDFFTGPRQTILQPGEILTQIRIPKQPAHSGACYHRFALRGGQALAVAAVAARLLLDGDTIKDARIALAAVAPTPLRASKGEALLIGKKAEEPLFENAGKEAAAESQPIDDLRGSAAYRRDLVAILTQRALREAAARARGGAGVNNGKSPGKGRP